MTEPLLKILKPLANLAEEAQVTGLHAEALSFAITQFNAVLEQARQRIPDDPVWSVLTPLDPERHGFAVLALACRQLLEIGAETAQRETSPLWRIGKDMTIASNYEGSVVVEPDCRLLLTGSIEGGVTLRHGSRLELGGVIEGDVTAEPGVVIELRGCVEGDVYLQGNARLVLEGIIEGNVDADPESEIEYRGIIEGSVRTRPASQADQPEVAEPDSPQASPGESVPGEEGPDESRTGLS